MPARARLHHPPDPRGEVPEWSNGAVSKTVVPSRGPRVRIPVSPPQSLGFVLFCQPLGQLPCRAQRVHGPGERPRAHPTLRARCRTGPVVAARRSRVSCRPIVRPGRTPAARPFSDRSAPGRHRFLPLFQPSTRPRSVVAPCGRGALYGGMAMASGTPRSAAVFVSAAFSGRSGRRRPARSLAWGIGLNGDRSWLLLPGNTPSITNTHGVQA